MRRGLTRTAAGVVGALALYALVLRRRLLAWGATGAEADGPLPGDGLIPRADVVATRAIAIAADVDAVWPWVAQLGQGRGGFYSYDWAENLVGCRIDSADRIVPQWQHVAAGDDFRLHPDVALTVAQVDPPRALVVQGVLAADGRPVSPGPAAPYDFTWAFVLVPEPTEAQDPPEGSGRRVTTRLLVRERYACHSLPARLLVETVSVVSFAMTERMLRGIRDRAQRRRGKA